LTPNVVFDRSSSNPASFALLAVCATSSLSAFFASFLRGSGAPFDKHGSRKRVPLARITSTRALLKIKRIGAKGCLFMDCEESETEGQWCRRRRRRRRKGRRG
jgi:hypothetical protein